MNTIKPWQSKTVVINSIIGICAAMLPFLPIAHIATDFISSNAMSIGVAWSILNLILRSVTKNEISLVD